MDLKADFEMHCPPIVQHKRGETRRSMLKGRPRNKDSASNSALQMQPDGNNSNLYNIVIFIVSNV